VQWVSNATNSDVKRPSSVKVPFAMDVILLTDMSLFMTLETKHKCAKKKMSFEAVTYNLVRLPSPVKAPLEIDANRLPTRFLVMTL
jgi:hypothetical protein